MYVSGYSNRGWLSGEARWDHFWVNFPTLYAAAAHRRGILETNPITIPITTRLPNLYYTTMMSEIKDCLLGLEDSIRAKTLQQHRSSSKASSRELLRRDINLVWKKKLTSIVPSCIGLRKPSRIGCRRALLLLLLLLLRRWRGIELHRASLRPRGGSIIYWCLSSTSPPKQHRLQKLASFSYSFNNDFEMFDFRIRNRPPASAAGLSAASAAAQQPPYKGPALNYSMIIFQLAMKAPAFAPISSPSFPFFWSSSPCHFPFVSPSRSFKNTKGWSSFGWGDSSVGELEDRVSSSLCLV